MLVAAIGFTEREDRLHAAGVEILGGAHQHDVAGGASGVATQVDRLARVARGGPARHPQRGGVVALGPRFLISRRAA